MQKRRIVEAGRTALSNIDLFSLDVSFRENKREKFTTCFGSLLSLLILLIAAQYFFKKLDILTNYEDTIFNELELLSDEVPYF